MASWLPFQSVAVTQQISDALFEHSVSYYPSALVLQHKSSAIDLTQTCHKPSQAKLEQGQSNPDEPVAMCASACNPLFPASIRVYINTPQSIILTHHLLPLYQNHIPAITPPPPLEA
jgi:hypothetical protein